MLGSVQYKMNKPSSSLLLKDVIVILPKVFYK